MDTTQVEALRVPPPSPSSDAGMVTAEIAIGILSLVVVLVPILAGLVIVGTHARAQDTARAVAREIARGESVAVAQAHGAQVYPAAQSRVSWTGQIAWVEVSVPVQVASSPTLTVRAKAAAHMEP